jgi:hypothetical protein
VQSKILVNGSGLSERVGNGLLGGVPEPSAQARGHTVQACPQEAISPLGQASANYQEEDRIHWDLSI